MNSKSEEIKKRHAEIKSIIISNDVYNQNQLAKMLAESDIEVTQATLSRDLTELGVVRVPTINGLIYKISSDTNDLAFQKRIAEEVLSIESNECMILVKTYAGRAQGVALFLDKQNIPEIIGTIAGDDTIMVAPRSIKKLNKTIEKLKTLIGTK